MQRGDRFRHDGWRPVMYLLLRDNFDQAQADLNAEAARKGWQEYEV